MFLLQHRAAAAIVLTACAIVSGVFVFARPEYRQPGGGKTIRGTAYPAATPASGLRGWTWPHGQPGFAPTTGHEDWNISLVGSHDLMRVAATAPRFGVRSSSIRLLAAMRLSPHDLNLLVSGADSAGATCIGGVIRSTRTQFFCPSASGAHRLGPQVAFVIVAAKPSFRGRGERGFPLFLEAATRGDVTRVVLTDPERMSFVHRDGSETVTWTNTQEAYRRNWGWWGTFGMTLTDSYARRPPVRPWRVRLDFYGERGLIASRQIRIGRPHVTLVAVTP